MFFALFMGLVGGPMLAWMFTMDFSKDLFEKRKAAYAATGKGADPEKQAIGPHKTFKQNLTIGFFLFFLIGLGAAIGISLAS